MHLFKHYELDEAQGLLEYALIMLLIALFVLASATLLGSTLLDFMQGFAEQVRDFAED